MKILQWHDFRLDVISPRFAKLCFILFKIVFAKSTYTIDNIYNDWDFYLETWFWYEMETATNMENKRDLLNKCQYCI